MSVQYRTEYTAPAGPSGLVAVHERVRGRPYRRWIKRLLDVAIVLMASVPVALTVGLLAMIQFIADRRNPFYCHDRIGRNGRSFRMWKLRTMVWNADTLLEGHLSRDPEARAEWEAHQKLAVDPRITPFGHFLRSTSLDELPQLWNVLTGTMSIVGPRPMMTCQRVLYPGTAYYSMRPGITGYWQISERNEACFHERADYDEAYCQDISLTTDLKVMIATIGVVLRATGR